VQQIDQDSIEIAGLTGLRKRKDVRRRRRTAIENRVQPAVVDGGAPRRGSL